MFEVLVVKLMPKERKERPCGLCDVVLYVLPNIVVFIGSMTAIFINHKNKYYGNIPVPVVEEPEVEVIEYR